MTLTTMTAFHLHDVTKKFGRTTALDAVTCDIPLGHVHGLIGRNGAGKTTLFRTLAGQIRVSGTLTLGDASGAASQVWDNPGVLDHLVLAGADVPYPSDMSVRTLMDMAAARWTTWDEPFATELVDRFGVDPKARFSTLSRGQKTLASLVIGLGLPRAGHAARRALPGPRRPEPRPPLQRPARRDHRRPDAHLDHLQPPRGGRRPAPRFRHRPRRRSGDRGLPGR